ncbi:MAG: protein translocase subunit SecD [Crocinitomicaceae bacterium]|nr:protein translocase subunit SecD [Flavobacteriales bacterium]NQZ35380.1 protein translocase subunit SecD [Crocinitomicaceae bacterium]
MRNKGFFWFLTILLTAVCLYQLSFTWVANSVENKAEKEAQAMVDEKFANLEGIDSIALPNNTYVQVADPEAQELAKSAYINEILKLKADKPVYPLFGSTFKEVKKRSLAFGLDLVGGMSVTMEISVPELLASYARDSSSMVFQKVYKPAKKIYDNEGGSFIEYFAAENAKTRKGKLVQLFAISDIEELGTGSTDDEVIEFLESKEKGAMVGVEEIMNRRINQFGVAQPNIQKDPNNNRLYIELPGVQDEVSVAEKLKSTANLQFFETYEFQSQLSSEWNTAAILSQSPMDDLEEVVVIKDSTGNDSTNIDSLDAEDDKLGSLEQSLNNDGKKGLGTMVAILGKSQAFVEVENVEAVKLLLAREDIRDVFPDECRFMWGADLETLGDEKKLGYFLYPCRIPEGGKARVGGEDIKSASRDYDSEDGKIAVGLRMTQEGADKWAQMTEENVNRIVAITMDGVVFSAPNVINAIRDGNTSISGSFSVEEADNLAGLLNGGALPAPCVIKEQMKVGPTIGAENAEASLISFGIALLLVFIYMIFYYGKAGIVADIALFANILFLFGTLASFGAVLTLAGMAGIVLTIGMAVDANVLIFERIREEQAAGKDLKSAVDTGFQKALSSIIDANVTTLLTAIVLKVFGSGPIESFATTLIIGIFTSVFAALVISRLIINMWLKKKSTITFETKLTKGAFKNFNIDFLGKRKMFYIISSIIVVGGLIAIVGRGLNPSVEFTGGRTFGVKFEKTTDGHVDAIKEAVKAEFNLGGGKSSVEAKTKANSYFLEISTNYKRSDEGANELVKKKLLAGLDKVTDKVGAGRITESRAVSPSVSDELLTSSTWAIVLSLIVIFAYILLRFGKWQYSTGAILAMLHDVVIVLSLFALLHGILPFNMDIDQAFIAAILTVIGYSINDTVIVFDRIRENLSIYKGTNEKENINKSLNSTLSRTINTSMTTFMVLLMIFLFGGAAIKGFIFALMIGVVVGTYSSLFIATPLLVDLSKKVKLEEKEV